ncbi:MAG: response regulator [Elusimicrobiota bacterium]|jgi:DNA-binding response OmpR family regulator
MATILVVDDEPEILSLVAYTFEREGHAVVQAADGRIALARLGLDPVDASVELPDVIILDVMMPGVDGYTLSNRLMGDERVRGVPIVILTAKSRMRDAFSTLTNVAAYVEKPFDPKALRETVVKILEKP